MKLNFSQAFLLTGVLLFFLNTSESFAQPCSNGISTNPENPINEQFIPLANLWYPGNGTDTANPFLNSGFNWYLGEGTIKLYPGTTAWDHEWSGDPDSVSMQNPWGSSMPDEFSYLRPDGVDAQNRDFKWIDGWELLYMNMGYYPDRSPINNPTNGSYFDNHSLDYDPLPSDIPYFILYNRYTGMLRVIANVWYDGANYQNVEVILKFTKNSLETNRLTGLLRHASAFDIPLTEPTQIAKVHTARFRIPNLTQWMVADFQVGYDPCTCISRGELILEFIAFDSMNIDIIGRSISVEREITELDYKNSNFLNMSNVDPASYEPGTEIYQNMDALMAAYRKKLDQYEEDLTDYNDYNSIENSLLRTGVRAISGLLSGGISEIVINDSLVTWLYQDYYNPDSAFISISEADTSQFQEDLQKKAKEIIGEGLDFFTGRLLSPKPNKPKKPSVPVATIEESVYKGTISRTDTAATSSLFIPGSVPSGYGVSTDINPFNFPAYNEVLGMVSLLKFPTLEINSQITRTDHPSENLNQPWNINDSCITSYQADASVDLQFRISDQLDFALNPVLDFDTLKTKTYVALEVELGVGEELPEFSLTIESIEQNQDLSINNFKETAKNRVFITEWVPLELVNQYIYSLNVMYSLNYRTIGQYEINNVGIEECDLYLTPPFNPEYASSYFIESIKVKTMHDLYFEQIGSDLEQVNTTQIFSYLLYDYSAGINKTGADLTPQATLNYAEFDLEFFPGTVTLENETIDTNHAAVFNVSNDTIYIAAREIELSGIINVISGYNLVLCALEEIHKQSGTALSPRMHLKIFRDFYETEPYSYASSGLISDFCDPDSNYYQANVDAAAISVGPPSQEGSNESSSPQEIFERGSVTLYPNPARDLLTLRSSHLGMSSITIHDLSGRPIKQEILQAHSRETQVDLSGIAPGTYVVRVDCGQEVFSEKLVVTK